MADFRRWLYAFAVVALLAGLTVPASAQSPLMTCTGSANNPLIRAEEYTALAGDVFITCTGGQPTAAGNKIPKVNITIFTTNTAITSKITDTSNNPNFNEALLIVDEAGSVNSPNALLNCGNAAAPYSTSPANLTCDITAQVGDGTGNYTGAAGLPNVFQGRQVSGSFGQAIQFLGVPIDAPGPGTVLGQVPVRTLRITNVRVNAVALNVTTGTSFSLVTINTSVSFNGTNFGGNQIINVQNGTVRVGLLVEAGEGSDGNLLEIDDATFLQCNAEAGLTEVGVKLTEGFPTAFKVRNWRQIDDNGDFVDNWDWNGGSDITGADLNQNVPNALYNTESGLMFPGGPCTGLSNPAPSNPPLGTGPNGNAPVGTPFSNGQGICQAGSVSQGTRFAIKVTNIPAGSNPSVALTVPIHTGTSSSNATGSLVLICGANSHGQGGNSTSCNNSGVGGTSTLSVDSSGATMVIYEVAFSDPSALEFTTVPFYVNPDIDLNSSLAVGGTPEVGKTAKAVASFAPFYATSTSGVGAAQKLTTSFPIPRFREDFAPVPPIDLYTYSKCACDMLFPWVVANTQLNTSIVIANTSLDPCAGSTCGAGFTAAPQSGKVTFWFFGTSGFNYNPSTFGSASGAGAVIAPQTSTVSVPAGSYMAFVISPSAAVAGPQTAGNGLKPIGGDFAGYVIAQSEFQYCHGIASISGVGLNPQTYLGLVLDKARGNFLTNGLSNNVNGIQLQRTIQSFADELDN